MTPSILICAGIFQSPILKCKEKNKTNNNKKTKNKAIHLGLTTWALLKGKKKKKKPPVLATLNKGK